jgi:hypothetical protein
VTVKLAETSTEETEWKPARVKNAANKMAMQKLRKVKVFKKDCFDFLIYNTSPTSHTPTCLRLF